MSQENFAVLGTIVLRKLRHQQVSQKIGGGTGGLGIDH